jgi:hypothetical protein
MYNLGDDNDLDRLSREAAGKYEPAGRPDWEALSAELDKVMPVQEERRRKILFWWWLPVALLGGTVLYLALHNPSKGKTLAAEEQAALKREQLKTNTPAAEAIHPAEEKVNPQKETAASPVEKQVIVKEVISQASSDAHRNSSINLSTDNKKSVGASAKAKNGSIVSVTKPVGEISQTTAGISNPVHPEKKNATDNNSDKLNTAVQENNQVEVKTASPKTETVQPVPNTVQADVAATVNSVAPNAKEEVPVVSVFQADREAQKRGARGRGWSYSLLAGVDKSTVKFVYGNDPGYNLGIIGGYHLNDRWSLHTGAIYTQKKYKVAGPDFTAPKGTPVSYYKLETVEGTCRMWEIPILLRYSTHPAEKNSFFFSAGLSSYFMTKEFYDYFYYFNNNPVTRSNTYNSDDKHILSIVHLSAGFESRISKNWSLQIEPYGKLPMGGVGFGSIRLSSFGLNFAVQRRQPSR